MLAIPKSQFFNDIKKCLDTVLCLPEIRIARTEPRFAIDLCSRNIEATAIYGEESRDPKRDVPKATYFAIILISILFAFISFAMVVGMGSSKAVEQVLARSGELADPAGVLFSLGGDYVGSWIFEVMKILVLTSLFAGLVIVIFAAGGLDPYTKLFSWMSGISVIAIVAIEILVSLAVLAYFSKQPGGNLWKTKVSPVASIVLLAGGLYLLMSRFSLLAGTVAADVDPTLPENAWKLSSLGWFLVLSPFIAIVRGLIVASLSKSNNEALTRDFS